MYLAVSPEERDFLAGFLAADGSFGIFPNNRGTTWTCAVATTVRDDDAPLLAELQQRFGGRRNAVRARGLAAPQVCWVVQRKAQVASLAQLLAEAPFVGRSAHVVRIWTKAALVWSRQPYGLSPEAARRVSQQAALLRAARAYSPTPPLSITRPTSIAYIGGFLTGEACFHFSNAAPRLSVHVRADDRATLEAIREAFGVGSIYDCRASGGSAPSTVFVIYRFDHMKRAIEILDRMPLRGRKLRQYLAWRPGAVEVAEARARRRMPDPRKLLEVKQALKQASAHVSAERIG